MLTPCECTLYTVGWLINIQSGALVNGSVAGNMGTLSVISMALLNLQNLFINCPAKVKLIMSALNHFQYLMLVSVFKFCLNRIYESYIFIIWISMKI